MTNQLLLAQVLAEGFNWDYLWHWTHDPDVWKAVISAFVTILASLIAISGVALTARRAAQQMELSKQGTPPELTCYKGWLEVSEKYKELAGCEDVDKLSAISEEYREVESSRKAALARAVWERKVFSFCPNVNAQKLLMQINPSKIFRILNSRRDEMLPSSDIYVHLSFKPYLICLFAWVSLLIVCMVYLFVKLYNGDRDGVISSLVGFMYLLFLGPFILRFLPDGYSGALEANYCFRKIIISHGQEFEINIVSESNMIARRLMMSALDSNYSDVVYCPWEGKNSIIAFFMKIVTYFNPGYYVRKSFKNKDSVLWGSYKEELLNGDLKEKLGRKNTQTPNSDTQEESPPRPPQG